MLLSVYLTYGVWGLRMKFKIGQRVELINNDSMVAELGATAIVKHVSNVYINVIWKRDSKWHNQGDGGYYSKVFKHVKNQQLLFEFYV